MAWISRQQVIERLREANFKYQDKGKRCEIYRQTGTLRRINLTVHDKYEPDYVRVVLRQAGLSEPEILKFLAESVKT